MLCGEMIGTGSTRTVYFNNFDKTKVVKVAKNPAGIIANHAEFNTYQSIMGKQNIEGYFAKIHYISPLGSLLIQDFYPLLYDGTYAIPTILGDIKRENFGFNTKTNSVVCLDYAQNYIVTDSIKLKFKTTTF
jgi:hypothetical protein